MKVATGSMRVLIVLGANWLCTSRLPKLLKQAGCHVTVVAQAHFYIMRSSYIDERIASPKDFEGLKQALKGCLESGQYDWVTIGDDLTLLKFSELSPKPWIERLLPAPHGSVGLRMANWKHVFVETCETHGLPVPNSKTCHNREQLFAAARETSYPAILKASYGAGGDGVCRVEDEESVQQIEEKLSNRYPLLLQDFVDGRLGGTGVLYSKGTPICWIHSYKIDTYPTPFSPSSVREVLNHPALDDLVEKIGKVSRLHGFAGIDWIRRADDSISLLELNGRMTSDDYIMHLAGVDFQAAIRAFLAGETFVQRPHISSRTFSYKFPEHLFQSIEQRGARAFMQLWRGPRKLDVPWDEPRLVFLHLRKALQILMTRRKKKLRLRAS